MKSFIKPFALLFLASSLIACGSTAGGQETINATVNTPEPTETPKEPELKEIEITEDNWEDYFVITYTPKPSGDDDYLGGLEMAITLKDEYKDKLSDRYSALTIMYNFNRGLYYSSLNGNEYTVNEKVDKNTFDVSVHKGWDYEKLDDYYINFLTPVSGTVTISNDDMIQGKMLHFLAFFRDYGDPYDKTQDNGIVVKMLPFDLADEAVWGVVWPEDLVISNVKGKLFIFD